MSLFNELKRRNVHRVATAYAVVAWLAVQIAETVLPAFGFGDAAVRNMVIAVAIGFIPALIFAWVFQWSAAGLIREQAATDAQDNAPIQSTQRFDRLIILFLLIALGYFAVDKFLFGNTTPQSSFDSTKAEGLKSIVVLPFVNISDDVSTGYFSDGITEELLNLLARVPKLRVISRTSSFFYKDKQIAVSEIAKALNVSHVLEGSVRQSGNKIRITAQLIDATTDSHIWSNTFDRTLEDAFEVQDRIATRVVQKLELLLDLSARAQHQLDPRAYALFLQAQQLSRRGDEEGYERALALYQTVIDLDPNSARAWVGIATARNNQVAKFLVDKKRGNDLALAAAQQALIIDPDFAPAHGVLGLLALSRTGDLEAAARHYQRALQLEPTNLGIISNAITVTAYLGRTVESVMLDEYHVSRDPVNSVGIFNLGQSYYAASRFAEAISTFETGLALSPDYVGGYAAMANALLLQGDYQQALITINQESSKPYRLLGLAMAHHALGDTEASMTTMSTMVAEYGDDWAYNIAFAKAFMKQPDDAFKWLAKAVAGKDAGLAEIPTQPLFRNLMTDARWLPFLASISRSPEALAKIPFVIPVLPDGR